MTDVHFGLLGPRSQLELIEADFDELSVGADELIKEALDSRLVGLGPIRRHERPVVLRTSESIVFYTLAAWNLQF